MKEIIAYIKISGFRFGSAEIDATITAQGRALVASKVHIYFHILEQESQSINPFRRRQISRLNAHT